MKIREELSMDYIRITDENIEKEHICCAMSGKQGVYSGGRVFLY